MFGYIDILQIGAGDGLDQNDPIFKFLNDRKDLMAILIEPNINSCNNLKKVNANRPRTLILNCLIGTETKKNTLFILDKDQPCSHGSINCEHLIKHKHSPEEINSLEINQYTLDDILTLFGITIIGLLVIDTEGNDIDILNSIDFNKYSINHIVFEYIHSDGPHRQGPKLNNLMKRLQDNNFVFMTCVENNMHFRHIKTFNKIEGE